MSKEKITDAQIIEKLGGVNRVAKTLGYEYNTVYNWTTRGISAFEKVKHPQHFMPKSLASLKPLPPISTKRKPRKKKLADA